MSLSTWQREPARVIAAVAAVAGAGIPVLVSFGVPITTCDPTPDPEPPAPVAPAVKPSPVLADDSAPLDTHTPGKAS